jgi:hypothetical protein
MTTKTQKTVLQLSESRDQTALEDLLPLAEVARRLPRRRGHRPTHLATLHRWRTSGLKGIRLECLRVGGTWCTNLDNVAKFFAELTARSSKDHCGLKHHRAPQSDRVNQELSRLMGE